MFLPSVEVGIKEISLSFPCKKRKAGYLTVDLAIYTSWDRLFLVPVKKNEGVDGFDKLIKRRESL